MPATKFREIPKVLIRARLPGELEERVREIAYTNRMSLSATLAELIARGAGEDPGRYGLSTKNAFDGTQA